MKKISLIVPATAALLATGTAQGIGDVIIEIDLSGWQTWGGLGSANNTTLDLDLSGTFGSDFLITGVGWDLTIASIGASWQSEVAFDIDGGVVVTPGTGQTGTGSYSSGGIIKLVDANIANIVIGDGVVSIEAFETFDDPNNTDTGQIQDANLSGSLFLQFQGFVPTPPAMALLGVAAVAGRRRRRG